MDFNNLLNGRRYEVNIIDNEVDAEFVKEFRKKYKLTQIDLANIFGLSKKAIEKWEQGKNGIKGGNAILMRLMMDDEELLEKVYSVKLIESSVALKETFEVVDFEKSDPVNFPINNLQEETRYTLTVNKELAVA